jgi:hypothetical protein
MKYWYMITHYECPVCGYYYCIKERVYDKPRPEKWELRNKFVDCYDYCDG